jgi:hypothetical protein
MEQIAVEGGGVHDFVAAVAVQVAGVRD